MTLNQHHPTAPTEERRSRALTDQDIQALADEFESRLVSRFYDNLGRGVWGLAWKALLGAIVLVAAYGAVKGMKP